MVELIADSTGKGVAQVGDSEGQQFLNNYNNQSWLQCFSPPFKIIRVTRDKYWDWKDGKAKIEGWN